MRGKVQCLNGDFEVLRIDDISAACIFLSLLSRPGQTFNHGGQV